jgi:hypothetical protein
MGMSDDYTKTLVRKLSARDDWSVLALSEEFKRLIEQIGRDVKADSVSGKIATILIQHQIMHEFVKKLIETSNLYVQGEIWPSVYEPAYDNNKEQMTGWYIDYFEKHCISVKGKSDFIRESKRLNEIRNKVAHNLIGKNDVIINQSYTRCGELLTKVGRNYAVCMAEMMKLLVDLTKRVDFTEFVEL